MGNQVGNRSQRRGRAVDETKFKKASEVEYPHMARAVRPGVYDQYRGIGDTFEIQSAEEKGTWMELIDEDENVVVPAGKEMSEDALADAQTKRQINEDKPQA